MRTSPAVAGYSSALPAMGHGHVIGRAEILSQPRAHATTNHITDRYKAPITGLFNHIVAVETAYQCSRVEQPTSISSSSTPIYAHNIDAGTSAAFTPHSGK